MITGAITGVPQDFWLCDLCRLWHRRQGQDRHPAVDFRGLGYSACKECCEEYDRDQRTGAKRLPVEHSHA